MPPSRWRDEHQLGHRLEASHTVAVFQQIHHLLRRQKGEALKGLPGTRINIYWIGSQLTELVVVLLPALRFGILQLAHLLIVLLPRLIGLRIELYR